MQKSFIPFSSNPSFFLLSNKSKERLNKGTRGESEIFKGYQDDDYGVCGWGKVGTEHKAQNTMELRAGGYSTCDHDYESSISCLN